jgi:hypothetical protein
LPAQNRRGKSRQFSSAPKKYFTRIAQTHLTRALPDALVPANPALPMDPTNPTGRAIIARFPLWYLVTRHPSLFFALTLEAELVPIPGGCRCRSCDLHDAMFFSVIHNF